VRGLITVLKSPPTAHIVDKDRFESGRAAHVMQELPQTATVL